MIKLRGMEARQTSFKSREEGLSTGLPRPEKGSKSFSSVGLPYGIVRTSSVSLVKSYDCTTTNYAATSITMLQQLPNLAGGGEVL